MSAAELSLDLTAHQHIHVVGIGGAGMSAIATVLAAMGHEVSGSDIKASNRFSRLQGLGLNLAMGHDPAYVAGATAVTASTAIPADNVELAEARLLGIPVLSRADVLASIARLRRTLAVAGTHGKTTTSSMLSLILIEEGVHPSFVIGDDLNDIGTNAVWDAGEWLVVEADESDRTFLRLHPEIAVVTSVEPDHLDTYGSFEALRDSFGQFVSGATLSIVSADDPIGSALAPAGALTFGTGAGARYRLSHITSGKSSSAFQLEAEGEDLGSFELAVPGEHNVRNAAAAVVAALAAGAGLDAARRALGRFGGVARRYEFRGEREGVTFVDDYAHLPAEVRAALAAARGGGYERVVCVFQPHRYSRISALAPDFGDAFADAGVVFVTDVYSAGEPVRPGVTGRLVSDAVLASHPEADVRYVATHDELLDGIRRVLRPGDCCITLQAGDLGGLHDELLAGPGW